MFPRITVLFDGGVGRIPKNIVVDGHGMYVTILSFII